MYIVSTGPSTSQKYEKHAKDVLKPTEDIVGKLHQNKNIRTLL
jgi:precorrin-3B methylase